MHLKEKHDTDVLIRKKDVLESGTEYEITFVNAADERRKEALTATEVVPNQDEQSSQFYETMLHTDELESRKLSLMDETCDEPVSNYQLLNELTVNDIETLVKNNPFVLSDNELRTCSSGGHHQHFDDLKLIDFPVMWAERQVNEREREREGEQKYVSLLVGFCLLFLLLLHLLERKESRREKGKNSDEFYCLFSSCHTCASSVSRMIIFVLLVWFFPLDHRHRYHCCVLFFWLNMRCRTSELGK